MPHVIDNIIWHNGIRYGWIDGHHIRRQEDGQKIGYFEDNKIYNEEAHKLAEIWTDTDHKLHYEHDHDPVDLEHVNEQIEGEIPLLAKCAIKVFFDW